MCDILRFLSGVWEHWADSESEQARHMAGLVRQLLDCPGERLVWQDKFVSSNIELYYI